MSDIAKIAGVSRSTVSRSLNDSPLIAEETKERIKKIAEEQGFEINANARSLSTSRIGTVGVIYPENFSDFNVNLYFSSLHNQLRDSLEKEELDVIVAFADNRYTGKSNIKKLIMGKKIDGLIIVQSHLNEEIMNFLKSSGVPYVFLHHHIEDEADLNKIDVVYTDHFKGGYLATEHLLNLGHKEVLCISAHGEGDEYKLRTDGYMAALKDKKLSVDKEHILYGDISLQSGYEVIMANKEKLLSATAIFVQNDMMALGVLEACRDLQINVPHELALVGYDDIELCTCFRPYLTTIHQPREEIARLVCQRLVELLHSKKQRKKRKIIVQPKLIVRDSCGGK